MGHVFGYWRTGHSRIGDLVLVLDSYGSMGFVRITLYHSVLSFSELAAARSGKTILLREMLTLPFTETKA